MGAGIQRTTEGGRWRERKGGRRGWVDQVELTGYSLLENLNTKHEVRVSSTCNRENRDRSS